MWHFLTKIGYQGLYNAVASQNNFMCSICKSHVELDQRQGLAFNLVLLSHDIDELVGKGATLEIGCS